MQIQSPVTSSTPHKHTQRCGCGAPRIWPRVWNTERALLDKYDLQRISRAEAKRARRAERNMRMLAKMKKVVIDPLTDPVQIARMAPFILWLMAKANMKQAFAEKALAKLQDWKVATHAARRGLKVKGYNPPVDLLKLLDA